MASVPSILRHEFEFMNDAQLQAELEKCSSCVEKPCRNACPAHCDPHEFILAAKTVGAPSDIQLAATKIMSMNPFGGVCGAVCPDTHCMGSCTRKDIDAPVNIPAVQAALVHRARGLKMSLDYPKVPKGLKKGQKVAVVGGGPAGLACATFLGRKGFPVTVFEKRAIMGGACNIIPEERLPRSLLKDDIEWAKKAGELTFKFNHPVEDPAALLKDGFKAVCVAGGVELPRSMDVKNEDMAIDAREFLWNPEKFPVGKKVAIIGGGPVGVDAAAMAKKKGAEDVTCFYRRTMSEMPLTGKERQALFDLNIGVIGRTVPTEIIIGGTRQKKRIEGLVTKRVMLPHRSTGRSESVDVPHSEQKWFDIDMVIYAIGNKPMFAEKPATGVFYSGDMAHGASTVVEASASGKNTGLLIEEYLTKKKIPAAVQFNPAKPTKSFAEVEGYNWKPVSLETEFFGRKLSSPFLLSAAPPTDGYDQVKLAYEAGWPGVVMKTAFDGIPIHIPNHYMEKFDDVTYGNADNVSGHPLERVCQEIKKLVKEYPDRMTMGSTGGPVSGNDVDDCKGWQSNTQKLEKAGAMAVEYSLSCPQGGDSGADDTAGTIVSQNPPLAAKVIDWVMQISDPKIPKIFKLTGAVTSIKAVLKEIKAVFDKYPNKKAGITLANSFPGLTFRDLGMDDKWESGIVMGLSGHGVTPISNLTLADASSMGLTISGNGGPFDYKAACNFLALGAKTVQFCTLPTKMGVDIITELEEATSHMMQDRGIKSIKDLIGCALPNPIVDFMDLSPEKQISSVNPDDCIHCGNCTRCPYLAIQLNGKGIPEIDPSRCISCGVCTQQCPGLALSLRKRTTAEAKLLSEEW